MSNRVGETNRAKNGLMMKIIAYRSCGDMDIQFEDGKIVYNKTYQDFKKGYIKHPDTPRKKSNRVGETNRAKNGLMMKIIAYRSCSDMDIQFEDGYIKRNVFYKYFKEGCIAHPEKRAKRTVPIKTKRIGEKKVANNGLLMEIVGYTCCTDIVVRFEDGIVVKTTYNNFAKGNVTNPIWGATSVKSKNPERLGEVATANNGLKMKIIAYRSSTDVDIQFEDGVIVRNRCYHDFKQGTIGHPIIRVERIGRN